MRYRVALDEQDIREGTPGAPTSCAFAVRMKKMGFSDVSVSGVTWKATVEGKKLRGRLPVEARRFIERFDRKKDVEPIMFDILIPDGLMPLTPLSEMGDIEAPVEAVTA